MILKDKICMVTGASRGIGRAIAEAMHAEGARVYCCDKDITSIDSLCARQTRMNAVCLDVTDREAIKSAVMNIKKEAGRIDVLVNNAGVVFNDLLGMISRERTEFMFDVNVMAVIELTQLVARIMTRGGGGSIVNVSSVTAVLGSAGQTAYSASKGAIISFTKSAAKELAPKGIRVNAVAPGIIKTERFEELYGSDGDKIDRRIERIGLGRLGEPADVANACVFLASDKASYISGQILGVDGCASI